jgi:hypothetical protein
MADFSNLLKMRPAFLARRFQRGEPITDEMLLDALPRIEPALLPEHEMKAISRILHPQRGRPPKNAPTRELLAQRVLGADRPDVPPAFLEALAVRLRSQQGLRDADVFHYSRRPWEARWRDSIMKSLYSDFYSLLDGGASVTHRFFGEIEVPRGRASRSEKALAMTRRVMKDRIHFRMPSPGTMRNIISRERNLERAKLMANFVTAIGSEML